MKDPWADIRDEMSGAKHEFDDPRGKVRRLLSDGYELLKDYARLLTLVRDAIPMVMECFQTWPNSAKDQPRDWLLAVGRLYGDSGEPISRLPEHLLAAVREEI